MLYVLNKYIDTFYNCRSMSSEKRDLSDLLSYEGKIIAGKNLYEFPIIYNVSKLGKVRSWNIFIRLIKKPKKPNRDVDWNVLCDEQLPMKEKYISGDKELPPNSVAQYWIVTGEIEGKKTRHSPSYGKKVNVGKANERNSLQTAIITARNTFLKKIKQGFRKTIKEVTGKSTKTKDKNVRYFPMLPVKYVERYDKIKYPCYVQPKLDGTRVLAYLYKDIVILYTRELKDVPGKDKIREQLKPILEDMLQFDDENKTKDEKKTKEKKTEESIYIDFEFYKFGKKLQDISSDLRNENVVSDAQCWVFDAFYPSELKEAEFDERTEWVDEIFDLDISPDSERSTISFKFDKTKILKNYKDWLDRLKKDYEHATEAERKIMFKKKKGISSIEAAVKLYKDMKDLNVSKVKRLREFKVPIQGKIAKVPTLIAKNKVEEEYIYRGFMVLGFEGSIVRNKDGLYRADPRSKTSYLRSMDVQKRKPVFTDEFEIVGFTEGKKGRDKGALIWILTTPEDKRFNVTPKNVTIAERKKLFSAFIKDKKVFDNDYKGKKITVEFEDKSALGIPLRAKALGLRPYT